MIGERHARPRRCRAARRLAKKRDGLPIAATACTRWPAKASSDRRAPIVQARPPRHPAAAWGIRPAAGTAPLQTRKSTCSQARQRLAQGPGRKQATVAEAAHAIDHADLHVARQRVVLQAVIGDHHIAAGVEQQPRGSGPIAADRHRHAGGADQAGFVADLGRIGRVAEQQTARAGGRRSRG